MKGFTGGYASGNLLNSVNAILWNKHFVITTHQYIIRNNLYNRGYNI